MCVCPYPAGVITLYYACTVFYLFFSAMHVNPCLVFFTLLLCVFTVKLFDLVYWTLFMFLHASSTCVHVCIISFFWTCLASEFSQICSSWFFFLCHSNMLSYLFCWDSETNDLLSHFHVWFNFETLGFGGFPLTILIFVFELRLHFGTLNSQTHYESANWTCIFLLMILNFSSIKLSSK